MTKYKLVHFGGGTPHMKNLIVAWTFDEYKISRER